MESSTDANGVVTSYSYWTDNSGAQNAFAVDRLGVTTRDLNGVQAETQLFYPNPNVTITKQDRTTKGDEGMVSYDIRDAFGRPQETDQFYGTNLLVATCTKRDALGNAMFVTVPFTMTGSPACPGTTSGINTGSNPGTTYARDVLGRVYQTTYADGSVGTMSYSGTAVTTVDPAGHKKVLIYDVDQNLATVQEDPSTLNYMTQYQHDVLDNLTAVCQGGSGAGFSGTTCQNGQGRSFGYDSLSRLLTASNPESGTFSYTYDNAGNLTQRVEGARGITTTYGYDALNRLTGTSYSDGVTPSVSYTWDTAAQHGVGQLQSVTASNGVTQAFTGYDSLGNVTGSVEAVGSNSFPFVYRSNLASELVSETYPSGRVMTMGYDGAGRETNVSGLLGTTTTAYVSGISYAPQGSPTQYTYKNGVSRVLSYNARLQPATAVDGTGLSGGSIATPLFSSTWNWNFGSGSTHQDNGNLAADSYTHSGGGLSAALTFAHSFSYDNVNRLTAASEGSNWTRGFGHDFWGNGWVSAASGIAPAGNTPTSNVFSSANNRISSASYDAAGNQTVVNGNALTYDAESRVNQVTDSGGTESILYDGSGDRIEKVVAGVGRIYVYDAFGTLTAEYSAATAATYPCTTCYLSADQIGSTRLVTSQTGAVVARHDFLPFGEEITSTGGRTAQWGSTSDVEQKFTGQLRDTESGLDFFNARYYGYALNRFTSPDPANAGADPSNPQSWNGYAYVMNNPLVNVDPGGLDVTCGTDSSGNYGCTDTVTSTPIGSGDGGGGGGGSAALGGTSYQIADQTPGNVEYGYALTPIPGAFQGGLLRRAGGGGQTPTSRTGPSAPPTGTQSCVVQRLALAAKGLVNLGVASTKIDFAAASAASAAVTGPLGVAGTAYGMIGASGNLTAGIVQILGGITGNIRVANETANVVTTTTTVGGLAVLLATRGNLSAASAAASFESLGTAGVNGGLTGHLIDEGATLIQKALLTAELGQNAADAVGIETGGSCGN